MLWSVLGVLSLAALAFWGVGLARTYAFMRERRALDPAAEAPADAPRVSVVVPARNEEHNIERCLSSLLAQRYPDYEVIVVDDHSTDRTGELARALADKAPPGRCTVLRGADLPDGWLGKNWANWQGQKLAKGKWLLFTDADTLHEPGCLPAAMRAAGELGADLLTVLPHLPCKSFWEKVVQSTAINAILAAYPPGRIEDPRVPEGIANGQYLLLRRETYDALGGHETIRDRVADDVMLAVEVKRRGLRLRIVLATDVLQTHMYSSLREIWHGYAKNMHSGSEMLGALRYTMPLFPFGVWIAPVVTLLAAPWAPAWVGAAGLASTAVMFWNAALQLRMVHELSPVWALTRPLGAVVLTGISLYSMWRAFSGQGPAWKGRVYPTAR